MLGRVVVEEPGEGAEPIALRVEDENPGGACSVNAARKLTTLFRVKTDHLRG
jgi:hypothetical protein